MFTSYFDKLEVTVKEKDLSLVKTLQKKHLATFSFNNFAVIKGHEISLNIHDIIGKIVSRNEGGYCFEHNKLMHDVLKYLGFDARLVVARVINNQDIDSPRTHRITLLTWRGDSYLIDVGFGANCPTTPLTIDNAEETESSVQLHRIIKNKNKEYQVEVLTDSGYFSLYTFNLERYTEADCSIGNFYSSRHPNAAFVNNLVASLILPKRILSLINGTYQKIEKNNTEYIEIKDYLALQQIIKRDFFYEICEQECENVFNKFCLSH